MDYAYLVTLGAMIAVIAATALYTDQLHRKENVQAAAPAPEINSTPTASPKTTPTASPLPTLAPLRSGLKANAVRPVSPAGRHTPLWISKPRQARMFSACATAS